MEDLAAIQNSGEKLALGRRLVDGGVRGVQQRSQIVQQISFQVFRSGHERRGADRSEKPKNSRADSYPSSIRFTV